MLHVDAEHNGICADQPYDEKQDEAENLALQAAYFDSAYRFHMHIKVRAGQSGVGCISETVSSRAAVRMRPGEFYLY
jgi:hypothetical protein